MSMTESERQEMLTEARIFHITAPTILPILEKRKKVAFDRLMLKHREGSTDYLTLVAELNVLTDIENEINRKAQTFKTLEDMNAARNKRD
jgi:hypothetical protein